MLSVLILSNLSATRLNRCANQATTVTRRIKEKVLLSVEALLAVMEVHLRPCTFMTCHPFAPKFMVGTTFPRNVEDTAKIVEQESTQSIPFHRDAKSKNLGQIPTYVRHRLNCKHKPSPTMPK
jgi:hypothetical protein